MSQGIWSLAISLALGAGPYPDSGTVAVGSPVASPSDGYPATAEAGLPVGPSPTGGYYGEPLFPYDSPDPWMHGYFQEMPSYGGYSRFRPYNYKHVLSQSQVAGGWGMSANMPYSQQFWHRYAEQAQMRDRFPLDDGRRDPAAYYGATPPSSETPATGRQAAPSSFPSADAVQQRFTPQTPVDPAEYQPPVSNRQPIAPYRSSADPYPRTGPRFR